MGLSISHGIVAKHNGVISVDSQPGYGSTFSVYLPIIDAIEMPPSEFQTEKLAMGNEQILLVDDEESLARSIAEFLQQLGYRVSIESQGNKALEAFKNQMEQFDLVITDQTMPGLTGLELAAELLKIKADLPIILCTGYSSTATAEKATEVGIRSFFMKPLILADLAAAVRACLDSTK
jgi:DNA-binding NtrC family response regulator